MTALQSIIKEAKAIRKKKPSMEWKKAVAQASAIYASQHKGKSPVGKKHAVKKKAAKKKAVGKVDKKLKKGLASKGLKMPHGYDVVKRKRKISGVKRKPSEKAVYKSIVHAAKVQKSHMSGISGHAMHNIDKELKQIKHLESLINSNEIAKRNTKDTKAKKAYSNSIKKYKELMREHKVHISQLKKHI